jgi:hypothetical protein
VIERSPLPSGAASSSSLAHEDKTYRPTLRSIPGARQVAFVLAAAGGAGLLGLIPRAWPLLVLAFALAFFVAIAAVVGVLLFLMRAGERIRLSPRGIEQVAEGRGVAIGWDEVAWVLVSGVSLWGLIPVTSCQIGTRDGRFVRFSNAFDGFSEMVARVGQETTPRLLAMASERIAAGDDVAFGRLTACAEGIKHEGGLLPWRAMDSFGIADGRLLIRSRDPAWPSCAKLLADIENLEVLLRLMAQRTGQGA